MTKIDVLALAGFAIHDLFRWPALGMNNIAVDTRKTYGLNSAMTQRGQNVRIDLAGKDHLGHLQSGVVGYAPAFDNYLLHAHQRGQVAELFAATVHHAQAYAQLMHQSEFLSQRDQPSVI